MEIYGNLTRAKVTRHGLILDFQGEIDISVVPALRETTMQALDEHPDMPVVADLANVVFIDSAAIGLLIAIKSHTLERGAPMYVLLRRSSQPDRILTVADFSQIFTLAYALHDIPQLPAAP